MAYTLSQLLQDSYRSLGRTTTFLATSGSATTIACTALKEKFQEDEFEDSAFFITDTTDGLTPKGKFGLITSYSESSPANTFTIPTVTDVVAAGDTITIVDALFPLQEMISLSNLAMSSMGDITLIDTSITTSSAKTEYAIPVGLKRRDPIKVQYQSITTDSDDNKWFTLQPSTYEIVPAAGGSTGLLIFRDELPSGHNLKIWYRGVHPDLTIFSSTLSEYIHPQLAQASLVLQALIWYNSQISGSNDFWAQRQNKAEREFEIALQRYPIWRPYKHNKILVIGSSECEDTFTVPAP